MTDDEYRKLMERLDMVDLKQSEQDDRIAKIEERLKEIENQ